MGSLALIAGRAASSMSADANSTEMNSSHASCAPDEQRTGAYVVTETTIIVVVSFLILVLNLGNLLVLRTIKFWHKSTVYLVMNLTLSDLCVAIFTISAIIPSATNRPLKQGEVFCQIQSFLGGCSATVSLMTLAFISVDRYIIIAHPLHHRSLMSNGKILAMVVTSWTVPVVLYIWVFWEDLLGTQCNPDSFLCSANLTKYVSFVLVLIFVFFLPANGTIVYCYGTILYIARKHSSRIQTQQGGPKMPPTDSGRTPSFRGNYKAATLFIAIFGMFNLCWAPYVGLVVYRIIFAMVYQVPASTPHFIKFLFPWMAMSNSFVNIFIYFGLNAQYRKAVKHLLRITDKSPMNVHERTVESNF